MCRSTYTDEDKRGKPEHALGYRKCTSFGSRFSRTPVTVGVERARTTIRQRARHRTRGILSMKNETEYLPLRPDSQI